MLGDAPGEEQIAPRRLVGLRLGRDLHRVALVDVRVGVLDEQPAEHARVVALARRRAPALAVWRMRSRLLRAQRSERLVRVLGRDQHLDELLGEPLGERPARPGG